MIGYKADPIIACNFSVTFERLGIDFNLSGSGEHNPDRVGFSKIFGLDQEITVTEVTQGSYPEVFEIPSKIKHGAVTFERGMSQNLSGQALYQWFRDTMDLLYTQVRGKPERQKSTRQTIQRRDVTIEILRRPQAIPGVTVKLIQAWPTKFSLGPLDANTNSVWITSMELRHAGILVKHAESDGSGRSSTIV